jgi:hypothetical protein
LEITMKKLLITLAALAMSAPAMANVICTGCELGDGAGSFLGVFNASRSDKATFQNSEVGPRSFEDFWVFDLNPVALGSVSADFTLLTSIGNFAGELYRDAGSVCAGFDCSSIALGPLLASATAIASRWEIITFFVPGRYVLKVGGDPTAFGNGAYTAQMSFLAIAIREPGTLGLLGAGLLIVAGLAAWRKRCEL